MLIDCQTVGGLGARPDSDLVSMMVKRTSMLYLEALSIRRHTGTHCTICRRIGFSDTDLQSCTQDNMHWVGQLERVSRVALVETVHSLTLQKPIDDSDPEV